MMTTLDMCLHHGNVNNCAFSWLNVSQIDTYIHTYIHVHLQTYIRYIVTNSTPTWFNGVHYLHGYFISVTITNNSIT